MNITKNSRVLFIGDSITDSDRNADSEKIGFGYVRLIRDTFICNQPNEIPTIINKGIGGDRVIDLAQRWEQDVLQQDADLISVSIGINDVWKQLKTTGIEPVFPDQFEEVYRDTLIKVKERTNAQLILMEPTIIEENPDSKGNQLLIRYVEIVHKLSKEFETLLVPTHTAFINYLKSNSEYSLTTDGVHMNTIGNMLMAKTWLDTIK
ncbi:SGNH/GDSL hydrolase family protein [Metabacillus arenae]|uniref:SGNH/GDSL hydrolase family protein n=1 Tax=Metabacillus arenae TaxID=2771434 RepID=A0A926RYF5_9BACI|nr:SGNH/GDSL hydrolase family protein [Metabacillus arenae]MBD1381137.1 SGNH/GDSL hydrolase family protein [Metabacillus arenae]